MNYRIADWEAVREEMALRLEQLEVMEEIHTTGELNVQLDRLTQVILEVVDAVTIHSKAKSHSFTSALLSESG